MSPDINERSIETRLAFEFDLREFVGTHWSTIEPT